MGRINCLVPVFSDIALQHYQMLQSSYRKLETLKEMSDEAIQYMGEIDEHYIITIAFAAMTLEAFLNDYAAARLGDDLFYSNFEGLRPFAKIQFISKVMFNTFIDKGGTIYSLVEALVRERNKLVHCKSRAFTGYSEEELVELAVMLENDENEQMKYIEELSKVDLEDQTDLLRKAKDALRALKEVANYFDKHDKEAYAMSKLLYSGSYMFNGTNSSKYNLIISAQKTLGVKPMSFIGDVD